jgi:hypothetical protein
MASCLALTMVLGMSLNSFAALRNTTGSTTIISGGVASTVTAGSGESIYKNAIGQTIHERSVRRVSIADFNRLLQVCNEQYEKGLVKRTQGANNSVEGTAEPVGPDVTDPEVYVNDLNAVQKPLAERQYTGRTVDVKHIVYGPVNELTGKPTVERVETNQLKLQSMHDYVSKGNKIRFVNGTRLSDTEFVIRVDCDIQDTDKTAPQSFRGDYYVSAIPYREREIVDENGKVIKTTPVNVPDEFGDLYNNKMYGPAWFFCMLFDETQPIGKRDIIGYLVAQRITRWPDWNDNRFYYGEAPLRKLVDGVVVNKPNPTQIARESATVYAVKHNQHNGATWEDKGTEMKDPHSGEKILQPGGQKQVIRNTFFDVSMKYPRISFEYPKGSSSTWLATTQADNPNW